MSITPTAREPSAACVVRVSWNWSAAESRKALPESSKYTQGLSAALAKELNWNFPKHSRWLS
ncbi:hypothetical protein [Streptomyces olivaceus]|uniref:hypothetical protein n=1 Tax=Streptomyces olivaceus TaxID=47716 RepID=UPI001CCDAA93|nr:hypothetical protein [Streptomyces olivaceus]MBZ6285018.1 hypothetical protein [Streptomyces olivaceus]